MGLYKSKNITAARKTAQKWFGKYIRLRDSDAHGVAECVTCGSEVNVNQGQADCSHWIEASIEATCYEEFNAHASCKRCNLSDNGMAYYHGEKIRILHGDDVYYELINKANRNEVKRTKEQIMEIAREYKQRYEQLKEIK